MAPITLDAPLQRAHSRRARRRPARREHWPVSRMLGVAIASALAAGLVSLPALAGSDDLHTFPVRLQQEPGQDRSAGGEETVAAAAERSWPRQAPAFSLLDIRGARVESSYASRPVTIVHFWATWCVPCIREIPHLNRLADTYEPLGAALFAVDFDGAGPGELREIARTYKIQHTVLIGEAQTVEKFGGVAEYPTTFLVDSGGEIVERLVGASPEIRRRLEAKVRAMVTDTGHARPSAP